MLPYVRTYLYMHTGVPPTSMVDDVTLIEKEGDKRTMLLKFPLAFHTGRVEGIPMALNVKNVRVDTLERQIGRVVAWVRIHVYLYPCHA